MQTLMVEAHVGDDGHLRLDLPIDLPKGNIKAVLVLDDMESSESPPMETVLLSQQSLAEGWERAEEDEAWKHLQLARIKTDSVSLFEPLEV